MKLFLHEKYVAVLMTAAIALSALLYAQEPPQQPNERPPLKQPEEPRTPTRPGEKQDSAGNEEKDSRQPQLAKEQIDRAYPVGERLTFDISWSGIHAGTAIIEVTDKVRYKGRECFRIRSYTNSARAISLIYKVEDRIQSYVDAETLEPLRSDKCLNEGPHQRDEYILWNHADRTAKYFKKKDGSYELRREHTGLPRMTQDSFSVLYFLRTMKLELGKSYEVDIVAGRRLTRGAFAVAQKKELKLEGVGTFTGLRLAPRYAEVEGEGKLRPGEGLFVASGDSQVWVDEATGMPLTMYVDIPIGSIRVQLSKREKTEKDQKPRKELRK